MAAQNTHTHTYYGRETETRTHNGTKRRCDDTQKRTHIGKETRVVHIISTLLCTNMYRLRVHMYLRYDSPPCVFGSWVYHNIICCWHRIMLFTAAGFSLCVYLMCDTVTVGRVFTRDLQIMLQLNVRYRPPHHRNVYVFYVARVCLCFVVVLYVALAHCATNLANRLLPTIATIAYNCALPISKNPQMQTRARSEFVIRDTTKKRNYITWQYLFCYVRRREIDTRTMRLHPHRHSPTHQRQLIVVTLRSINDHHSDGPSLALSERIRLSEKDGETSQLKYSMKGIQ